METTTPSVAVSIRSVFRAFGTGESRTLALRNVDLDVRTGELLMLVGPSGCGKTTLISVLAGTLKPDAGQARIFGQDLVTMGETERVRFRARHIGFVFQAFNLIPTLTVAENVAVPLLIQGVRPAAARARSLDMLARVGLKERGDSRPALLSGGQQQRVAIARALVHQPRLVVCDEPTSALDAENGRRVMDVLRQLSRDGGATLVIVTHDSRIFEFADRIAHMDDGRIQDITTPASTKLLQEVSS